MWRRVSLDLAVQAQSFSQLSLASPPGSEVQWPPSSAKEVMVTLRLKLSNSTCRGKINIEKMKHIETISNNDIKLRKQWKQ